MLVSEEETRSNSNLLASPCRPKEHVLLSPIVAVPFRRHPTIGNNTGACPLQNSGFPCQRYSVPEASLIEVNSAPRDFKVTDTFSLCKVVLLMRNPPRFNIIFYYTMNQLVKKRTFYKEKHCFS